MLPGFANSPMLSLQVRTSTSATAAAKPGVKASSSIWAASSVAAVPTRVTLDAVQLLAQDRGSLKGMGQFRSCWLTVDKSLGQVAAVKAVPTVMTVIVTGLPG